jgi:hypothetical protein
VVHKTRSLLKRIEAAGVVISFTMLVLVFAANPSIFMYVLHA